MGRLKKTVKWTGISIGGFFALLIILGAINYATTDRTSEKTNNIVDKPKENALSPVIEQEKKEEVKEASVVKETITQPIISKLDSEEKILEFVKNYQGTDGLGFTLFDTIGVMINVAYPNENILENPSTTGYFIASKDYSREISDRYWKVEFELQTYKETSYFVWMVDTDTNKVFGGNELGNQVLQILDNN